MLLLSQTLPIEVTQVTQLSICTKALFMEVIEL